MDYPRKYRFNAALVAAFALITAAACADPTAVRDEDGIPVLARGIVSERYTAEVAAANGYAYTSTWGFRTAAGNVVKVWDVRGTTPVLVDSLRIAGVTTTSDVQISPDQSMLVVSTEGGGSGRIVLYNLADPAHPAFVSQFQHEQTLRGVHTVKLSQIGASLYAFLQIDPSPDALAALMIVDITDPLDMQDVYYQPMGAPFVHDVFVRDGLLFAALWNDGMRIFDIGGGNAGGTPSNPVVLGNVQTPTGQIHNIWWVHDPDTGEKRYALLGEEGPGMVGLSTASGDIHVIDVSDLTAPRQVAIYTVPGAGTHNFFVDEESMVLYAAYYNAGVRAIDVRGDLGTCTAAEKVPAGANAGLCDLGLMGRELAAGLTTGSYVWGVTMQGNRLYASDMRSGLAVLDISALKR